jgi:agmatine/peptidylarginine deiminase
MVDNIQENCTAWIVVGSSSEQSQVESYLTGQGVPLTNVEFLIRSTNSVWMRDYGPWLMYEETGDRGIVDFIYNRPRPQDDAFPGWLGGHWGIPVYGPDLTHAGGNFMVDGYGTAMASTLVYDENPGQSEAEIDSIMRDYLSVDRFVVLQKLNYEYTGHIDMYLKFVDPGRLLVGEYQPGQPDYSIIENNVAVLETLTSAYGEPYEIVRIPMPNVYSGVVRSYTNSLTVDDMVLVPTYGISLDDSALAIYQDLYPSYDIVGLDCSSIIQSGGAIHCVTMQVPTTDLIFIHHVPLPDTAVSPDDFRVEAGFEGCGHADVDSSELWVRWNTTGIPPFDSLPMHSMRGDSFYADIPIQDAGTTVYYYVHAANPQYPNTHPLYAPENGVHSFYVDLAEVCGDANGDLLITPSDGYMVLNYLGAGPEPVSCFAANVNGDDGITPGDGYTLLNFLGGGAALDCAPCEF